MSKRFALMVLPGLALVLSACAGLARPSGDVTLHILAINDFHGNLEPPRDGLTQVDPANPAAKIQIPAGGSARMGTLVKQLVARAPGDTIMVAAGDLIGASPLLSSLFHDEPTIESLSQMGLALSAVGNHEFDKGLGELRRMQAGGCHPETGCNGPHRFKGAGFSYLAAGTIETATGKTIFPPYAIRQFEGVKVGFIGLSLKGVPDLISPADAIGLEFRDEAETINALVPKLKAQGVEAIVVLIHEGGYPGSGPDPCSGLSGPITRIVPKLDPAVDLIVSGHTHMVYACRIDGRLVTSAGLYSTTLTDITVTLDRRTHDVVKADAANISVRADTYADDPGQLALIAGYRKIAEPLMQRRVGSIAETLSRDRNPAGENVIGDVVTDAMRAAGERETGEKIDVAFTSYGTVRLELTYKGDGAITFADMFAVQPYSNKLVAITMTGRDIEAALAQQFSDSRQLRVLHVSQGFAFAWRKDAAGKGEVVPGSVTLNGRPLDPAASYRVVTNNYLTGGGDGFTAFKSGTRPVSAGIDSAALEAWFKGHSPVRAPPLDRIRLLP